MSRRSDKRARKAARKIAQAKRIMLKRRERRELKLSRLAVRINASFKKMNEWQRLAEVNLDKAEVMCARLRIDFEGWVDDNIDL